MTTDPVASLARPVVLKNQDQHSLQPRWRHYFVVDESSVTIVEMVAAALGGWKTRHIDCAPSSRDWPGMTAEAIVAWKLRNHQAVKCDENEAERVLAIVGQPTVADEHRRPERLQDGPGGL